jgi:predicted N-acetyltransferase YhbS
MIAVKERSSTCRDMLVRLYDLPEQNDLLMTLKAQGIEIRRALMPEKHRIVHWTREQFSPGWASEVESGFHGHPIRTFIATKNNQIIGVSVYDAVSLGVAAPLGVDKGFQGKGVGRALLLETLHHMQHQGYAYAVIGWVAPETHGFYQKIAKAQVIEGSAPHDGMYQGLLIE